MHARVKLCFNVLVKLFLDKGTEVYHFKSFNILENIKKYGSF